jgi:PAS domain S-box-containing protein
MEASHHSSDLDPSSVLGFGAALPLIESAEEVGRLLTGALRSMGISDLQAVVLRRSSDESGSVVGSMGMSPLADDVAAALRHLQEQLSTAPDEQAGTPARRQIDLCEAEHAPLLDEGLQSLTVVRLGTVDDDFGLVAVGRTDTAGLTPMEGSSLQMMAAQVSMALHRIRLDRQRRDKAEALRVSEARYRELYENAPVAYVTVDADGRIRMANEQAATLLHTTTDTLRDRTLTHFCSSTDAADETARRLATCIRENERFYDQQTQICRADGTSIWVSMSVQPVEPSTGEAECLVTMRDVTEQVRMERALRDTRDELEERVEERTDELERANERLQEQAERLSILRDIDQAILAAESPEEIAAVAVRRAEQVVSCERVSVTVIDWDADEAEILAAGADEDVLNTGTRVPLDEYYLPPQLRDGEPKRIADLQDIALPPAAEKIRARGVRSVLCLPMMVEGELVGVLKMGRTTPDAFTDDDEHIGRELADHLAIALRQAKLWRAVQEQREQLATLRDVDQAILAAESPTEIAAAAIERVQALLPYESATVSVLDDETEQVHVLAEHNNVLDAPTTLPLDKVYLSDNLRAGQTEVISVEEYTPVPEAEARIREMGLRSILCLPMVVEDEVIGVIHVGRTKPDAFTNDDWQVGRELADHLAIALRQSQLLEEVQEQRERLEERVQERTAELESFTYSVSHDLRTPLRAIDGYARILKEDHADQLDEEGRRLLNVIYDSAQTMGDQIDDLLTLSRVGRREINRVPIDVGALAQEAFDELQRAQPDQTADIAFEVQALPDAEGDRSMLRHVFSNVLSNAVKFVQREEDPRIEVGSEARDDGPVYYVRDNGVGFDPERTDEMFGVFQRLHDEDFEGTGVGLALVERVLRRHDGEVWAEGEEGEGATIYFTLPPFPHE